MSATDFDLILRGTGFTRAGELDVLIIPGKGYRITLSIADQREVRVFASRVGTRGKVGRKFWSFQSDWLYAKNEKPTRLNVDAL